MELCAHQTDPRISKHAQALYCRNFSSCFDARTHPLKSFDSKSFWTILDRHEEGLHFIHIFSELSSIQLQNEDRLLNRLNEIDILGLVNDWRCSSSEGSADKLHVIEEYCRRPNIEAAGVDQNHCFASDHISIKCQEYEEKRVHKVEQQHRIIVSII